MSTREIVLCHPVRTAIAAYNGSLRTIPATDLGATVVRETHHDRGNDYALENVTQDVALAQHFLLAKHSPQRAGIARKCRSVRDHAHDKN